MSKILSIRMSTELFDAAIMRAELEKMTFADFARACISEKLNASRIDERFDSLDAKIDKIIELAEAEVE